MAFAETINFIKFREKRQLETLACVLLCAESLQQGSVKGLHQALSSCQNITLIANTH